MRSSFLRSFSGFLHSPLFLFFAGAHTLRIPDRELTPCREPAGGGEARDEVPGTKGGSRTWWIEKAGRFPNGLRRLLRYQAYDVADATGEWIGKASG
jgi:hypothetical protein